ncbi:hypothetical protein ACLB2K_006278 [Fragaria x ananassa]
MSPFFLPLLLLLHIITGAAAVQLRPGYYSGTCPEAETIVRDVMKKAFAREPRSLASVMRFQFHDCFVNGCDASMLLDDTPTMLGEKLSLSNINSLRSYEVVDEVKEALEKVCPGVVSCADIIIMASRDAVALTGGPDWQVKLGRLDSLTASQEASDNVMPSPRANATFLIDLFAKFNLSVKDLVALSGSHSIGQGRCFSIMFRLYNQSGTGRPDPALEPMYREKLNKLCPLNVDQNVTGDLDATPIIFDNQYFKDLASGRGFLNSDQTLFTFPETRGFVKQFSIDQEEFFKAFVEGMIKMGDLQVQQPGEIRKNCRVANRRAVESFWEPPDRLLLLSVPKIRIHLPRCHEKGFDKRTPKPCLSHATPGCDASLLLDDTPTMLGEKLALANINSLRSYEVVDEAKEALEEACPGVVSCANLIIMAFRDAVALTGGPDWEVKLGRLDSLTASQEASDNVMPSPRSNATFLIDLFSKLNLSAKDMVALSGSHSIGKARCFSIMFRLYNQSGTGKPDPAIEPKFREELDKLCPLNVDQNVTGDLDATSVLFDNQYFKDLVSGRGFLNSDQTLFTFPQTREFVNQFSIDQEGFFKAFVEGMLKMGDLQVQQPGEIRKNCRGVDPKNN